MGCMGLIQILTSVGKLRHSDVITRVNKARKSFKLNVFLSIKVSRYDTIKSFNYRHVFYPLLNVSFHCIGDIETGVLPSRRCHKPNHLLTLTSPSREKPNMSQ
uniref:Uncharacterized protein n=1 Tax=Cacopsylla melanoneura TaxID=428564 RepID=A0A8D9E1W5_9HEMI